LGQGMNAIAFSALLRTSCSFTEGEGAELGREAPNPAPQGGRVSGPRPSILQRIRYTPPRSTSTYWRQEDGALFLRGRRHAKAPLDATVHLGGLCTYQSAHATLWRVVFALLCLS
jgi:hypothetical protein